MRFRRFALACLVLFVVAIAWSAFVHLVLLRRANAVIQHIHRLDVADRMGLSLLVIAGMVVLFVWGYGRFARRGSIREGVGYGLFFSLLTGVLVDFKQYVLFPIPGWLAFLWFLGGVIEFILYGMILSKLYAVFDRGSRGRY